MSGLLRITPAVGFSALGLACASAGRGPRSAACTQPELDSLWFAAGPVYRACEVDVPARHENPYGVRIMFEPFGAQSCYDAQVRFVVDTSGATEVIAVCRAALLALIVCPVAATTARAQHDHAAQPAAQASYGALVGRETKALSDTQIAQYRNADGMGFALAAELNHYPGPRHALELADSLGLSAEQRTAIGGIRERMIAEARRLGESIVERERALGRAFASATISETELRALTGEVARLQGELRFTHLRAHVALRALLTADQIQRYDALRRYGGEGRSGG